MNLDAEKLEVRKLTEELILANKELAFQAEEKRKRAAELVLADKELAFQTEEKRKRAAELVLADKELAFQTEEKRKRAAELVLADKELAFQTEEKRKRAAELVLANKELAFQAEEKRKRAEELVLANKELAFQTEEKKKRAAELVLADKELAFQTEEKKKRAAELILADKELEYAESIINTVHSPFIVLDHDLRVISASRSFYHVFKVKPEETVGQLIYDLGNQQWDIPKLRELLETILPQQATFDNYEVEHDFAAIGRRVMLLNARQVRRALGKERIILLSIEDITERMQLEDLLAESEERFRRLFETADDGILLLEKSKFEIRYANPAVTAMLGYSNEECIGKEVKHIGFPDSFDNVQEILQRLERDDILYYNGALVQNKARQVIDTDIYLVDKAEFVQCNIRDITVRKQAEATLKESEERFHSAFEYASIGMALVSPDGHWLRVNKAICDLLGYTQEELLKKTFQEITHPDDLETDLGYVRQMLAEEIQTYQMEKRYLHKLGQVVWILLSVSIVRDAQRKPLYFISQITDISKRKAAEESAQRQLTRIEALYASAQKLAESPNFETITQEIVRACVEDFGLKLAWLGRAEADGAVRSLIHYPIENNYPREISVRWDDSPEGGRPVGTAIREQTPVVVEDIFTDDQFAIWLNLAQSKGFKTLASFPLINQNQIFGSLNLYSDQPGFFTTERIDFFQAYALQTAAALENARSAEALLQQNLELSRLYRASGSLVFDQVPTVARLAQAVVDTVLREFKQSNCSLFLIEENNLKRMAVAGRYADDVSHIDLTLDGPGLVPSVARSGRLINREDVTTDPDYVPNWKAARSELAIPLVAGKKVIGVLDIQSLQPGVFSEDDERIMLTFAGRSALALENARLASETQRRLERLSALRSIDQAIAGTVDLKITLKVLNQEAIQQLGIDAVDILLYDPHLQTLEFAAESGFHTPALQHTSLRLGEGFAGQAALERRIIHIGDIRAEENGLNKAPLLRSEGFVTYYGVPLIAKGEVKGVMELFHRAPLALPSEWLDFLKTLAGQAAIAIDNANLFSDLRRSNTELVMAYDATIEGWSRALDLRDKETEGHTQRVAAMTIDLARALRISNAELVHIRRGALLHDIGKMGVPDAILHKPGPLTDEEWVIMRKHPKLAYDMLSPIEFLRPALHIPGSHHEKWDGTGYPRGLSGEQIPLAARIFAIVDVWDALNSDRPYRDAWPQDKTLEHIRSETGTHFDPHIVDVFLKEISEV